MSGFLTLRPSAQVYVALIVVLGAATLAYSVSQLYVSPVGPQWLILAGLTVLTGTFTVKVPSTNASISVSEAFVFASVLLFGPAAGVITVLLECLVILFWMKAEGRPMHRVLFNLAAPSVSIFVSGTLFFWVSGIELGSPTTTLQGLFSPLLLFTTLYFIMNSSLVAVALGFETDTSPLVIWWNNFTWLSVNYFSGASVAALLVTYTRQLDLSILGIIVPLLVVSYLTFRISMARVEDSYVHLAQVNSLYLSTIETLAMAIDAKDQITHGHIRRVQTYAVGLARRVGVSEPALLQAIEAAALLHDMGKLAVPEYILNKPGKLSHAEFEKMKRHAPVGADLLSAIHFPYPVVPIVRHHHENWDGTGYPAGLQGIDIPIGARVLAVVDCFDALTSDRPYRPKLPDNEAIRILLERRGSMYDPLIVDTFIQTHVELVPTATMGSSVNESLLREISTTGAVKRVDRDIASLDTISSGFDEMPAMLDIARVLAACTALSDALEPVASRLRRLTPFALAIFYCYDEAASELVALEAVGEGAELVRGLRIPVGQRLSGWVAANHQTIANSDAILDLGDIARTVSPPLRACLSSPMTERGRLAGVLTLYSSVSEAYTEDHVRLLEEAAKFIGPAMARHSTAEAMELTKSQSAASTTRAQNAGPGGRVVH
jgi:putative nucleotidyltransferase with HDIG domain